MRQRPPTKMSLVTNSNDVNIEIFKYLQIEDLLQLYNTNKTLKYDVEKYSKINYNVSFQELLKKYKCIHCYNICETSVFKLCDNCVCDTCWKCFNKTGSDKLIINSTYNNSGDRTSYETDYYYFCCENCES